MQALYKLSPFKSKNRWSIRSNYYFENYVSDSSRTAFEKLKVEIYT